MRILFQKQLLNKLKFLFFSKIDTTSHKLNVLEGSQYFLNYIEVTFEPGSITQNLSIFIFFPITQTNILIFLTAAKNPA